VIGVYKGFKVKK